MTSTRSTAWGLLLLPLLLLWEASGLDLALARLAGTPQGFAWRDDWWLTVVLHDGARHAAWAMVVLLCLAVVWPRGAARALPFRRRLQVPAVALMATALVAALKAGNTTSCPWDMADFGGVAQPVWHWRGWTTGDGGGGHCFPAGHATAGFAWVGGWFAWREASPGRASRWLAGALVAGALLGLVQQWRGAHFASHTLWSGWLCWMLASLSDRWFADDGVPA
ncbi:MAG TPA: phosphatase PAP2 family protein [Rhizobacter sp.]